MPWFRSWESLRQDQESIAAGGLAYRILRYPARHFVVVLMGRTAAEALY
jgi:hypothetical protein